MVNPGAICIELNRDLFTGSRNKFKRLGQVKIFRHTFRRIEVISDIAIAFACKYHGIDITLGVVSCSCKCWSIVHILARCRFRFLNITCCHIRILNKHPCRAAVRRIPDRERSIQLWGSAHVSQFCICVVRICIERKLATTKVDNRQRDGFCRE